jgi:hypothetical protein
VLWREFYRRGPFGPRQENIRAALIVVKVHNANCGKGQEIDVGDVFPSLRDLTRPPPKPLAVQKAEARARAELSRRRNRG